MNRRSFLSSASGIGFGAVSGCTSIGGQPSNIDTSTRTTSIPTTSTSQTTTSKSTTSQSTMSQQTCPEPPAEDADTFDIIPQPPDDWTDTFTQFAAAAGFIPLQRLERFVYRKSTDEPYGLEVTYWPSERAANTVMMLYDEVAKTDLALVGDEVKTGQAGPQSSVFNLLVWLKRDQYIFAAYGNQTTPAKTLLAASPALNKDCVDKTGKTR